MENNIQSQLQKIINFYKIKDYKKVIELSTLFLKKNSESDIVLNLLGLSYQKIGRYDKSETSFVIANQINPDNISVLNNLGNNFKYKLEFTRSREYFYKAIEKNSNYTEALLNLGTVEFVTNNNETAIKLFERALKTNNKAIPIHLNLAIGYQSLGNFDKAIHHLNEINNLDEKFTRADKMLSSLLNYKTEINHYNKMLDKLERLELTNEQKIYLFFALGKAYEDKENYSKALDYFKSGNKHKRKNSNYDLKKDEDLVRQIKSNFKNFDFKKNLKENNKKPIFIVGMPRSGTTLVEQIISSHKDVQSLGEINFFNIVADQEFRRIQKENLKLDLYDVETMIKKYENHLNNFEIEKKFFTDKTLLNFFWIGFIKMCYPKAKIINCLRDAKDNCLSIYKNLFDYEGAWCYDESELTSYYKIFIDITQFWKKKIPESIYEIRYEELINYPEKNIKDLVDYCELDWDESCLDFHKNKSAIKTLSVNQARKKIYSSSVNSFSKYQDISNNLFKNL